MGVKLNLLVLHNSFLPESSGSSVRLYNLTSRLPCSVSVIAPDILLNNQKIRSKEDYFGNVKVKRFSFNSLNLAWNLMPFRYFYRKNQAFKIAQSEEFDIIQSRNIPLYMSVASKLSEKLEKPLVIEYSIFGDSTLFNNLYNYYLHKISQIIPSANHIITLTDKLKEYALKSHGLTGDKITVIKNGVDTDKFSPKNEYNKKSEEIKIKLNLSDNIVMYAGYMDNINGISDVLKYLPTLLKENDDMSFLFIGSGPEVENVMMLARKYSERIKYLSSVPYEEMPFYYQICDAFIIPRPSSFPAELITPLKLLEVMAMKKPVLGSDVGGISEVIDHGVNGYLFSKGDMESFKKELNRILDSGNRYVGKNARKKIIDNYNWNKSAQLLSNIYKNLI